jgi:hypothetical protein
MTILQIVLAVALFALAFWLINHFIGPGLFKNILIGCVVVLALIVILSGLGLMPLLNTPITGRAPAPGYYPR